MPVLGLFFIKVGFTALGRPGSPCDFRFFDFDFDFSILIRFDLFDFDRGAAYLIER